MEEKIYIWGTGYNATYLNENYQSELFRKNVIGYIDNDANKWGKLFFGRPIFAPDIIGKEKTVTIFISIQKYEEIIDQINEQYKAYDVKILDKNYWNRQKIILSRYAQSEDPEIKEVIEYLNNHELQVFNYSWTEKYKDMNIEMFYEKGLFYTWHKGRKLYFSRKYGTEDAARTYYTSLLLEQDEESPHKYLTDAFRVEEGDIVIDAGAAEGIFSLENIDKAKKIYLFEPDPDWIEALKCTFSDQLNKVRIIDKCVSNYFDFSTTTIDSCIEDESINFIKLDIEGEEYYALKGARDIINKSKDIKCVVCTYHQEFAYHAIKNELECDGFTTEHSAGYMWYIEHFNQMRPMVLRRGLIRARKK